MIRWRNTRIEDELEARIADDKKQPTRPTSESAMFYRADGDTRLKDPGLLVGSDNTRRIQDTWTS